MLTLLRVAFVVAGLAVVALGGLSCWRSVGVNDYGLPESRELRRQVEEFRRVNGARQWKAIQEDMDGRSPEGIPADPGRAKRTAKEVDDYIKESQEMDRQMERTIQARGTEWRMWHLLRGAATLTVGLAFLVAGIRRCRPDRRRDPASVAAPGGGAG